MTIPGNLIDVVLPSPSGYPEEYAKGDTREALREAVYAGGGIVTEFPSAMWIERREWADVARQLKETRTRAIDFIDRFTNQNPTHECTCHSLRVGIEGARNRQRRLSLGPPVANKRLEDSAKSASVWLSALSVYAEANPRQWGGAGIRQVLRIATERGMLPEPLQPRPWKFKHTLHGTCGRGGVNQSRGQWVALRDFPQGWQETSKHFKPLEYIFPDTWEQSVCLVLNSLFVCVGRDGHAVPHGEWMPDDEVVGYPDSYDVMRYDSIKRIKDTVGVSFSVVSTTTPDDWDKPAGE